MEEGANISTGVGTGEANVFHFEQFNNTVAQIQQRDITNQQYMRGQYDKMQMQLGDAGRTMRPADMPKFMEGMKAFREAGLMLQSSKVKNDPKARAEWEAKRNEAYYGNLNLAGQSKQQQDEDANVMKAAITNPSAFKDYPDMMAAMHLSNGLTIDQVRATGFNTPFPFLHAPDAYKVTDLPKQILGDQKVQQQREPVLDASGQITGYKVQDQNAYERPVGLVAAEAARSLGNRDNVKLAQSQFAQADPKDVQETIEKAEQAIAKTGIKQKLPNDYTGYYTAQWILRSQDKTDAGTKRFEPDQNYQLAQRQAEDDRKQRRGQDFEREKLLIEHNYRLGEMQSRAMLKLKAQYELPYSKDEMFKGYNNPAVAQPVGKDKSGKMVYAPGQDIVNRNLQAILAKMPKDAQGVVLSRVNLLDFDSRQEILKTLLGDKYSSDKGADTKMFTQHSSATDGEENNKLITSILTAINKKYGTAITLEDASRKALPFITRKLPNGTYAGTVINTSSSDKFNSQLDQLIMQGKNPYDTDDDAAPSGTILTGLLNLTNQQ